MIEKIVDIDISGKTKMPTFVVYPSDEDIYPVVFLLMDAPGIRQELHDMASRIASCGYYVLCPNLYYRSAKPFKWNKPNLNFKEYFSRNKKKIFGIVFCIILMVFVIIIMNELKKKQNIEISKNYNTAKILIEKKNFNEAVVILENIINKNKDE